MVSRKYFGPRHKSVIFFQIIGLAVAITQITSLGIEPGLISTRFAPDGRAHANDSMGPTRNVELENTLRRASPFASEAQRQGIAVSEPEVISRLELYKKLYPNQVLDDSRVRRMLLAEKYLELKGLGLGGSVPEGLAVKKVDPSHFDNQKEVELAMRTAMVEALIGREDLFREVKKRDELAHFERESKRVPTPLWPLQDIQVEGDSKECLAWEGNTCIVNLGEYNAAAVHFRMQSKVPLDSAKERILKRYLLDKKLVLEGSTHEVNQNPDSILNAQKRKLNGDRWIRSAMALGTVVQDQRSLQSVYGKHYHEFFAAKEDATIDIIGSTDSAYVESLYVVLSAWSKQRETRPPSAKKVIKEPVIPWISFKEKDLPLELAAAADSFYVGQFSAPFRSSIGFFIVRLSKLVSRQEVYFEEAVPQLMYLATRDNFLEKDSILEALAKKYYKDNKAEFAVPDTLELLSWLLPRELTKREKSGGLKMRPVPKPDTAQFKSLALTSLTLPRELQIKLNSLARADTQKAYFGPLKDKFGRWHFRILSRKLARDTLPYRLARNDILEKISSPLPERLPGLASDESLDEVLLTLGTALAVRQREYKRPGTHSENGGSGQEIPIAPDGASESEKERSMEQVKAFLQARRDKKKLKEEEAFRTIDINFTRLFK